MHTHNSWVWLEEFCAPFPFPLCISLCMRAQIGLMMGPPPLKYITCSIQPDNEVEPELSSSHKVQQMLDTAQVLEVQRRKGAKQLKGQFPLLQQFGCSVCWSESRRTEPGRSLQDWVTRKEKTKTTLVLLFTRHVYNIFLWSHNKKRELNISKLFFLNLVSVT